MLNKEKLNLGEVYYTVLYSTLGYQDLNYNECLMFLLKNSILTPIQISIISKRIKNERSHEFRTAGSYYRQVKQCRIKIRRIIYTVILLRILNVIDDNTNTSLEQLVTKLDEVVRLSDSHKNMSHIGHRQSELLSMLSMLDGVITKLIKV
jgi:hypothetical protein